MYKMSMIRRNGKRDYYGIFNSKESAMSMAKDFLELDEDYVDYDIWYTE